MASASPSSAAGGARAGPPPGPPYAPQVQSYGGLPAIVPDVPISAVYLFLYVSAAVFQMTIFQINRKHGHLFVMSAMTFGFCMCRIFTFALRLSWAIHPTNVKLAIASNIFVSAGTPILYIINLIFAHRIIRAQHPRLGWHKSLSILARLTVVSIILVLIALIVASVLLSYTLSAHVRSQLRDVQLFGTTFYTFIAFLPLPMVLIGLVLPRRIRAEKFGKGRFRTKIAVLVSATLLLTFRAVWGTTAAWLPPVPRTQPMPFYYSKPVFYTVQLLTELLVVLLYAFVRVDRRFYTPTGQRNSYLVLPGPNGTEGKLPYIHPDLPTTSLVRVYSEEELFEEGGTLADTLRFSATSLVLDEDHRKWQLKRNSVSSIAPSMEGSRRWTMTSHAGQSMVGSTLTKPPRSRWSEIAVDELDSLKDGYA